MTSPLHAGRFSRVGNAHLYSSFVALGKVKSEKPCWVGFLLFCHFRAVKMKNSYCVWVLEFASTQVTKEGLHAGRFSRVGNAHRTYI